MILISHRGNLNGPNQKDENRPEYIDTALNKKYNAEIDIWFIDGSWYLGHDNPQYKIDKEWLDQREHLLWIHAKNIDAITNLSTTSYNYFWHENDTITLTSKKYIWAYPGKQKIKNSIAVMPEIYNDDTTDCLGICTDYIERYQYKSICASI
jgi:hypothetical protein